MNKMKKVLAVLLSMALVLGMSTAAFAAETTKARVTVNGADGATLKYVQIVKADTEDPDGWAIIDEFKSAFAAAGVTVDDLIAIADTEGTINEHATAGTINSSADLGKVLTSLKDKATISFDDDGYFDAEAGGLYLIVAQQSGFTYSPMLAYVPVNSTTAITVTAKGAEDQIKKEVIAGGESVAAGDVVNYTATVNYPYFSAEYTNVVFKVTDTLTNANFTIDANHALTVSINDEPLIAGANADYTVNEANGTDTLEITFNYDLTKAGKEVEINYYATVAETVTTASPLKNQVSSEIAPSAEGDKTTTEYRVISNPVNAKVKKLDDKTVLAGATFALYKGDATKHNEETSQPITTGTTGTDGTFTFTDLDGQEDYYIIETKAPDGYAVDKTPIQLVKGAAIQPVETTGVENGVTIITTEHKFNDFGTNGITEVQNIKLSALPSTGGIGTTIFTIGGCLIMLAAAALFFASRKRTAK